MIKSQLAQLLLLTVLVFIGLWLAIRSFVGATDDLSSSLDIRSLAYIRDDTPSDPTLVPVVPDEPMSPAEFAEPEPMATVDELAVAGASDEETQGAEGDEEEAKEEEEGEEDEEEEEENNDKEERAEEREGSSLSDEELAAREKVRRDKLAELGLLHEKPTETIAADVALIMPDECSGSAIAKVPAVLKFRFESSRIMGESLNVLESLLAVHRECEEGYFAVDKNPLGLVDSDDTLAQMRLDEIKYFFLQHNVSLDIVEFPTE